VVLWLEFFAKKTLNHQKIQNYNSINHYLINVHTALYRTHVKLMVHPKQHIIDLAEICLQKGVKYVVISPGSRNAPLIDAFCSCFGTNCKSIVDERSAGYFALGIARYSQSPVVLICTSGTATLNYSPALAEAYYQKVPLVAITADRPEEWIDQQDNQTIRQKGIYRNFIKNSYHLSQNIFTDDDLRFSHRLVNEAINNCMGIRKGPVHINIPLTEPLYDSLPQLSEELNIIYGAQPEINIILPDNLIAQWQQADKIIIVHGQDNPQSGVSDSLKKLSQDSRVVVIAENIANIRGEYIIGNPDLLLANSKESQIDYPDLLIYSGGQVVSKKLKTFFRKTSNNPCWRIGYDENIIETFQQVTAQIPLKAENVYKALADLKISSKNSGYRKKWLDILESALRKSNAIRAKAPFSDLKVFDLVINSIPADTILEIGNSSVIRYSQLFDISKSVVCYSNRGVSGIDGCLSTASGTAFASEKLTVIIIGDLSFVYDSNALWNRDLSSNLRIIVINNSGGGIFHLIEGPSSKSGFKKLIEAFHPVNINKLAEAFGVDYYFAGNEKDLCSQLSGFYAGKGKASVLEVKTETAINNEMYQRMMGIDRLSNNIE
jgi:2-succinyl-5-enolpyruvyl-6-hydroxy-3-cyclohexene-1-carboxylate synthase